MKHVGSAFLCAVIYKVWKERNRAYWEHLVPIISFMVQKLKQIIRSRILVVLPKKITRRDFDWFSSLH